MSYHSGQQFASRMKEGDRAQLLRELDNRCLRNGAYLHFVPFRRESAALKIDSWKH